MADLRLSEHTKLSGGGDFEALANNRDLSTVWIWDTGPTKPVMPVKPKVPLTKDGTAEHDLAMIDFREAIAEYEAALKIYKKDLNEFTAFQTQHGGAYEIKQDSANATDIFEYEAKAAAKAEAEKLPYKARFYISSRTRGRSELRNRGLPPGTKIGHYQLDQERRWREGEADMEVLRRSDPVFGTSEGRT